MFDANERYKSKIPGLLMLVALRIKLLSQGGTVALREGPPISCAIENTNWNARSEALSRNS